MNARLTKLAIVTGASQGFGRALVSALKKADYKVAACARSACSFPEDIFYFQTDLSDAARFLPDFERAWEKVGAQNFQEIVLINNAASLAPIGRLEDCALEDLLSHLQVNVHAPLLLNRWLLKKTENLSARVVSVGISSGAAKSAYPGWSAYCLSKAANVMMSQCLMREQEERKALKLFPERRFEIWDFNPGVMETAMQELIREQSEQTFPSREKFVALKEMNQLADPAEVAQQLVREL